MSSLRIDRPTPMTNPLTSIVKYEDIYGGREGLVDYLSYAGNISPEVSKALALLENPDAAKMNFNVILKKVGCTPAMFNAALRDATLAKGHALALMRMMEKLPDAVGDMVDAAITVTRPCDCTKGANGAVAALATCADCKGRGIITYRPDAERHRLVAEVSGLIKKGPTVAIQNNNNQLPNGFGAGSFDRLVKGTDAAMSELRPTVPEIIDATTVEETPND